MTRGGIILRIAPVPVKAPVRGRRGIPSALPARRTAPRPCASGFGHLPLEQLDRALGALSDALSTVRRG